MSPTVLPVLIVAGLIAGLTVFVTFRRPPPELWPALLSFQLCGSVIVTGYLLVEFAQPPWNVPVGGSLVYGGNVVGAALCWVVALRYAEAQHWPFPWAASPAVVWAPVGLAAAVGVVASLEVAGGRLPLPLEVAPGSRPWSYLMVAAVAGVCASASMSLFFVLAAQTNDGAVRRSALFMGATVFAALAGGLVAISMAPPQSMDPSIYTLAMTSVIFLVGAYRTRVISVLSTGLRKTLDHDPDAVVLFDANGLWLHSNPAAAQLLGPDLATPRNDVLGRIARNLRDSHGRAIGREELADRLGSGSADEDLLGPVCIDGERWLRLVATEIPSRGSGPRPHSLRLDDVTESQRVAAALRAERDHLEQRVADRTRELEVAVARLEREATTRQRAEVELRGSDERHRAIAEVSTDLSFAFAIDGDGKVRWRWVTRSVDSITGYTPAEIGTLGWQAVVHPDDLDHLVAQQEILMRGEPLDFEFRILSKSGETRWIEINIRGTPGATPHTLDAVGAVRDITERKRTAEERRQLERRKQETQRLESLGVLAGGIAHDFNNLLAVIAGNATLASAELASPDALQKRLDRIRAAADYAVALTDQILTYAGKPALLIEAVDLGDLVLSMLDLLRAATTAKVHIETQLCEDLPPIEGDPTQIRQILMNLISNAAESLEDSDGRILLRTGWIQAGESYLSGSYGAPDPQPGDYVYVEVVDNGRGIDEESRRRIFEPFFSTKFSGRGLGLAAVHGIVQAHGGVIKLTSEPGWGTAFRVLFPRLEHPLNLAAKPTPKPDATATPAADPQPDATILVVDDDEAVREIAQEFLQRAGFRVITASGGIEAVRRIEADDGGIGAVVLDLTMPDIDGEQTFREIRRLRPEIPVLLVSGYSEEMAEANFAGTEGADGFLSKPFQPEDLVGRIREVLAG